MATAWLARRLMQLMETSPPSPEGGVGELQEVFRHRKFVEGTDEVRRAMMLQSSEAKYRSEMEYPWDHYFGTELRPFLEGRSVLDLGCFTGGRGVAWCERYDLRHLIGVDVNEVFIDAAQQFARLKDVRASFRRARGEELLLEDESLEAVLSFDVFEHVQDVKRTLMECRRVLKPGGRLLLLFPGYYHPVEHHLSLATRLPCVHYFFRPTTLIRAYNEILERRGEASDWYKRGSPTLEPWERGNTINGMTYRRFARLLQEDRWKIVLHSRKPVGSIGRNAAGSPAMKGISTVLALGTRVPGLQEACLHRITYIVEKA